MHHARVDVTCPDCGPVRVCLELLELHENRADGFRIGAWMCPRCGELTATGDPAVLDRLAAAGARRFELRCLGAAPIGHDDLLAFHELLERGDWFERLTSGLGAE